MRFGIIAAGCWWLVWQARSAIPAAVFAHAAISFTIVTLGYAALGPRIYGKSAATGRVSWVFWIALLPVHALNALAFFLVRRYGGENWCDEVLPGVLLGRRLTGSEGALMKERGVASTLDLTSEFEDPAFVRALPHKTITVLDDSAPTAEQLREGLAWLSTAPRPVYVHCALGHGRSATFVAALALATGAAADAASAEAVLKKIRPGVRLNGVQRASLASLQQLRLA